MINIEEKIINDIEFIHTYSDTFYIRKVGTEDLYLEAYDLKTHPSNYEETDIELPKEEEVKWEHHNEDIEYN